MHEMNVAVIQLKASADKQKNIQKALDLTREAVAGKAEFILLPEMFHYRGKANPRRGYRDVAENIPGESLRPFLEEARRNKVNILAGSICEKIPGSPKVFNTSVLIDTRGRIAARYRKNHLFDATIDGKKTGESGFFRAGNERAMTRIGPWKIGLSICYDLRFPELYRAYASRGAHILCVPSAFTRTTGQAHWEILLRARAVENICYVLAPNQTGSDGKGIASYGNSMIIDPWGKILARASGSREEILFATLGQRIIGERKKMLGHKE
jgi:predicted amidohydrolase